eukprot:TRINITY_DN1356_c0_g3_i1.p1 TRINITY_DN1356_c0_g3~~TRINITY_DN1356_c0_g3_i1.p1  ORF type:complete len:192 (+),score=45.12 TRINITY_DN1356_c0_g3_i1:7-582(+)
MESLAAEILLLGNTKLREISKEVETFDKEFEKECNTLASTLEKFRSEFGFGRAISAPQIGINKRFIAFHLKKKTEEKDIDEKFIMINPVITYFSEEKFKMFDDCMSFPHLFVKLLRHKSISVSFTKKDENGYHKAELNNLDIALSELIQHEFDHLDGVLSVDRAIDKDSIVYREEFLKNKEFYLSQVDYQI